MFVIIVKYLNGVYFLKIIHEFISEQILIKIWVAYFCSTKMWDVVSNKDASFKKKTLTLKWDHTAMIYVNWSNIRGT